MPVIICAKDYPQEIIEKIQKKDIDIVSVDAAEIALKAGNIRTVNVVLLGVLSKSTDISEEKWIETIKETVPQKALDVNIAAFKAGRALV